MNGVFIALIVLQAGLGIVLVIRAIALANQLRATQLRVNQLETTLNDLQRQEFGETVKAAVSLRTHVESAIGSSKKISASTKGIGQERQAEAQSGEWLEMVPKLIDVFVAFSDPNIGRKPKDDGEQ